MRTLLILAGTPALPLLLFAVLRDVARSEEGAVALGLTLLLLAAAWFAGGPPRGRRESARPKGARL